MRVDTQFALEYTICLLTKYQYSVVDTMITNTQIWQVPTLLGLYHLNYHTSGMPK
jgi:hypothetical protein